MKFRNTPRLSLRVKAMGTIIVLQFVLVGTFAYLAVSRHHRLVEGLMKENYVSFAKTLAAVSTAPVLRRDDRALQFNALQSISNRDVIYVVFADSEGRVLAHARKPLNRKIDVASAMAATRYATDLIIQEVGEEPPGLFHQTGHVFDITVPVMVAGRREGIVHVGIFTASVNQQVAKATAWGMKLMLGVIFLGALVAGLVDRRMKKIVAGLISTTRRMASGDLSQKVEIQTGDALEELGRSFNLMAEALREREHQITRHKEELEHIVKARTHELQDEKNKLQAILDNVPSAFLLLDRDLRIQTASANLERLTGKSFENVQGLPCCQTLWEPEFCSDCPTKRAILSRHTESAVVRREGKSAEEAFIEHIAIPILKDGEAESVLEIITDITERKRVQDQLIRAEKLSTTGEMAAVIAHEMRNALTSVKMILQLQLESGPLGEFDRESLEVALDSTLRMENFVNELLQFARPTELHRREENIHRILEECVELSKGQLTSRGIQARMEFSDDLPALPIDPERLKEAVVNLILNAAQAIEGKGEIVLRTSVTKLKRELRDYFTRQRTAAEGSEAFGGHLQEIVLKRGTGVIRIDVEDTGCGIPAENLQRIFDPFYTTKIDGTGLGLSLVKRIANEHGGIVTVESRVGQGSTFSIWLPTP